MRIIGVIDLFHGRAVHARAGRRAEYAPVETLAGRSMRRGDPRDLALYYLEYLGIDELYMADLDAILGGPPQIGVVGDIVSLGVPVWLDAGITSPDAASRAVALGACHIVVGLETLPSFDVLADVCERVGADQSTTTNDARDVAFSLDLRGGTPVVAGGGDIDPGSSIEQIVTRAAAAGTTTTIVLDLARVGTGTGVDVGLIERIRQITRGRRLVVGGGIRHRLDLEHLKHAGCDGALVATALHRGVIRADDVAWARGLDATSRPLKTPGVRFQV